MTRMRAARWAIAGLAATAAFGGFNASAAQAQGVTSQQLEAHGWTCIVPPPFPDQVACFDPGRGRPFPGNPDPAPSYSTVTFDRVSGEFLWTVKLIRADLYQGQPCGSGGEPYRFIALIGYYECVHA